MSKCLTPEQQKGNLLREFDGFAKLAKYSPDFCVDVAAGVFGRRNGGDHNAARAQAETAVTTIHLMAEGGFGFPRAAKAVQEYFDSECGEEYIDVEWIDEEDQ